MNRRDAVVTGGGTRMGRELPRQLAPEGCHVAMCDISAGSTAQTRAPSEREAVGSLPERFRAGEAAVEVYPGTAHGFCFPERPGIYVEDAAEDVWRKTFALFERRLK